MSFEAVEKVNDSTKGDCVPCDVCDRSFLKAWRSSAAHAALRLSS
jgi:hypothetical protein